jgi:hypothetical protein
MDDLNEYIEYLLELTVMAHERSPQGYTDPQMKQYYLGQRDALKKVQKYIAPKQNLSEVDE